MKKMQATGDWVLVYSKKNFITLGTAAVLSGLRWSMYATAVREK